MKTLRGWSLALWLAASVSGVGAAETESHQEFGKIVQGYVAFCRPSPIGELQIIGKVRWLTYAEADKLAALLSAESTWYERLPDGNIRSSQALCMPHWDFKLHLFGYDRDPVVEIRVCSSCRQVEARSNDQRLKLPDLREPAAEALYRMFDPWFPNWRTITAKNRKEKFPKVEWREKPAEKQTAKDAQNRP